MKAKKPTPCGPAACLRKRFVFAPCDVCRMNPPVTHVPLNGPGFFCEVHCPNCNPASKDAQGGVNQCGG
jgi:hypothetical protein